MVVDKKLGISPLRRTEPIRDETGQYSQKCHHFSSKIACLNTYVSKAVLTGEKVHISAGSETMMGSREATKGIGRAQVERLIIIVFT